MSDQPYEPITPPLLELLSASPLFGRLDRSALAEIADHLDEVSLAAGDVLFRQGDAGDSLYIVDRGLLEVRVAEPGGNFIVLDRLDAGAAVGEMALLTGQPRTADVVAVVDSRLVRLSKSGYENLAERHPAIASGFALAITPRIQRLKLAAILRRLFGQIDPVTLHGIQEKIAWRRLADGETLMRQGEVGMSMFVVVNGRLQVIVEGDDVTPERVVGEVGAGETVGEYALLTDDVRSATVVASRDTDVVEITRPIFESLAADYPHAMTEIAGIIVARQIRSIRTAVDERLGALTIAVFPAGPAGAPLMEFSQRLREKLSEYGPAALFTSEHFDAEYGKTGAAQTEPDDVLSLILNGWLQEQEQRYLYILFVADVEWTNWTRRCLAQSDRIILVGTAGADPTPGMLEHYCNPRTRKELVLMHGDDVAEPTGTLAWLAERDGWEHHHVRWGDDAHWQRLVRRLTGQAIGAAFSGGAARGLAHIGVIRALTEANQPVDYIGGSSMGAFIGGGWAAGLTPRTGMELAARMANPQYLLDRTLPFTSVMASEKITAAIREVMGDRQIEDLWRPFFCVSTNLSIAEPVVHDRGPLWRAVRASIALPGVFTPILNERNEVLVDGGVMNNFPVDILASRGEFGLIIGCNVSPRREEPSPYELGESLSGWRVLRNRINPFATRLHVPSLPSIMLRTVEVNSLYHRKEAERLADILIEPDTRGYNFLDFAAYRALEQLGYEAGRAALAAWTAKTA
ncbi:MAG: patatin-like phospholipase domain-containing protein [Candidatus Promineofilum sp.]|uniref:cyclic nucleotide-binding and patatin-like phospholipase domain-containing protein n=1 Tax=Promineifilum sp. TaxID=2664178 RepID=UPI002411E174|nr:patatin-like phospholipase domain-containing protein [Promineifilum sp.]